MGESWPLPDRVELERPVHRLASKLSTQGPSDIEHKPIFHTRFVSGLPQKQPTPLAAIASMTDAAKSLFPCLDRRIARKPPGYFPLLIFLDTYLEESETRPS